MKRMYGQKSPSCRHSHESTKKTLLNKTNRLRKSSIISTKKTIKENNYYQHHHPYLPKNSRLTYCNANDHATDLKNKNDTSKRIPENLTNVDPTYLSTLRHEAYDELHRQMQQYNDSFVLRMQQQTEQQQHEATEQRPPHLRRRSFQKHRRRSSLVSSKQQHNNHSYQQHHQPHRSHPRLHYCHQEENDPVIGELVDMLETGTIKDYSLLTEWELYQNPETELQEEEHGGFGDLW